MERLRDRAIERVRELLESAGFYLSDVHAIRPTSFDLLARRDSLLLLLKILKNIDALGPADADRLRELGRLFPAAPLVIGQYSGSTELESGVVYYRYGVPIVVEDSLREALLEGLPPFLLSSPGGIFARIDGERLRALREARSLSLGALASAAGVSRRTIQLYEDGTGAEVSVVERLEEFLGEPVAMPIDLFGRPTTPTEHDKEEKPETAPESESERRAARSQHARTLRTGDPLRDTVFRQLDGMGWQVVVTVRCPFDAFNQGPVDDQSTLLTAVGTLRTARQRAELLGQLARVAEAHALFVIGEDARKSALEGLPVLTVPELRRHRDRQELLDDLSERQGS